MSNWVEPETIEVSENDTGPFYCYVLWVSDIKKYYVGHTGYFPKRMSQHRDGEVQTTRAYSHSFKLCSKIEEPTREKAAETEAKLKSHLKSGKHNLFRIDAKLKYFVPGATLLE